MLKKYLLPVAKIAIPIGIIVWLLTTIEPEQLDQLQQRPKNWLLLSAAGLLALLAVSISFVRWYFLVRALNIPFRLRDAFRLGFLGFLFNFVSFGAVGGDLFKAVFIAREQHGQRAAAVASVAVDRIIGLYALLVVASLAFFLTDLPNPTADVEAVWRLSYMATALGGVFLLMVLTPGFTRGSVSEMLGDLPRIGSTVRSVISSVRMYRDRKLAMFGLFAISVSVHLLLACSVSMIAHGLFPAAPSLSEHCIIVPISMVAGAMPFTPAGLGTFEFAMDELYRRIPAGGPGDASGILIALVYRMITIAIAAVGVVFYWTSRREVSLVVEEALHESAE